MRLYSLFITTTIAFVICVDASPTGPSLTFEELLTPKHEPQHFLRGADANDDENMINASSFENAEFLQWKNGGKSPVDVLRMLEHKLNDNFLRSSELTPWLKLVMETTETEDDMYKKAVEALVEYYGEGGLVKMVDNVRNADDAGLQLIASNIQTAQIVSWFRKNKTCRRLFHELFPNPVGIKLLKTPQFGLWYRYARVKFEENSTKKLVQFLMIQYNVKSFAKMLETSTKVDATRSIEKAYLKIWLDRDVSPSEFLTMLDLNKEKEDKLLWTSGFKTFLKYEALYKRNKYRKKSSNLKNMTSRFSEGRVAKMLEAAKLKKGLKKEAIRLQLELFESWDKAHKSFEDVMKLLTSSKGPIDRALLVAERYYEFLNKEHR